MVQSNQLPRRGPFLPLPWTTSITRSASGWFLVHLSLGISVLHFMLWGFGMSTAWMVRTLTQSWPAGLIDRIVCDHSATICFTPLVMEHLNTLLFGPFLYFLGSAWKGIHNHSTKWSLFAGFLRFLIALDSPYHAIYTAVASVFVLPFAFIRRWSLKQRFELLWSMTTLLITLILGAIFLLVLYQGFSIKSATGADKIGLLKK